MDIRDAKIPKTWEPHVELMFHRFDQELRIEWLPKWVSDIVIKFRRKNKIKEVKTVFAELKVVGEFTGVYDEIVKLARANCRDTCEFCGRPDTDKVIIKSIKHITSPVFFLLVFPPIHLSA